MLWKVAASDAEMATRCLPVNARGASRSHSRRPSTLGLPDQPVKDLEVVTIAPAGLRPNQAAQYLGIGVTFLQSLPTPLRVRGNGPKGKPVVIYLVRDLDAWLEEQAARRDPEIGSRSQKAS